MRGFIKGILSGEDGQWSSSQLEGGASVSYRKNGIVTSDPEGVGRIGRRAVTGGYLVLKHVNYGT
jgi:hypothetical protein